MPNLFSTRPPRSADAIKQAFQALLPSVEEMHTRLKTIFTTKYPSLHDRINAIEAKALNMHPDTDYRDLIYDELIQDPTRTDDEIAGYLAQLVAFP